MKTARSLSKDAAASYDNGRAARGRARGPAREISVVLYKRRADALRRRRPRPPRRGLLRAATGPRRVVPDGRRGKRQHRAPQNIAADLGDGRDAGRRPRCRFKSPAVPVVLVCGRRADVVRGRRPGQARGRLPAPAERRRPGVSDYTDRGRLQGVAEGDAADLGDGHQAGCCERGRRARPGRAVVLGYRGHG